MSDSKIIKTLEDILFSNRPWVIVFFILVTIFMFSSAMKLKVDAGFSKLLPLQHEYMQTFTKHREEFGGANRVLVALIAKEGDMFTSEFFDALKETTDDVFFIEGVDRTRVTSIFTPNVRFTEVVEDGIAGGNVVPDDYENTVEGRARVKENIIKAGIVGRLVANDFSGALISAQLLEFHPNTGERLDYVDVARQLEENIRQKHSNVAVGVDIDYHIIGFAKVIGDITEGAKRVVLFFIIALFITALLVYIYSQSIKLTIIPLVCSLVAVVWQLGILPLLGFGIDPMSILVPFLIFAIGVSHGVQMISSFRSEVFLGNSGLDSAKTSFRRLLVPGAIALASDTIGFITILLIDIEIIQEMAITASLGVAVIILTNLFLLPVLVSYIDLGDSYRDKLVKRASKLLPLWKKLARVSERGPATKIILVSFVLLAFGIWKGADIRIGDLHRGVPELHGDSQYNIDTDVIADRFSIGVDLISVIVETIPEGCINYEVMDTIDRFEWAMRNVDGVQSVIGLPTIAKRINAGWNEGNIKWQVLPRNQSVLVQSVSYVPTSSGLLNSDCSVIPVLIFTKDHKAETISNIVDNIKLFREQFDSDTIKFKLATGNVGVMAATNEEVDAAQFPILIYVFAAIIILCLITFRSFKGTLCIVMPLALVSLLAYALMTILEIGLKVNTLPVVALGVGVGVDYGIYIYSRLDGLLKSGMSLTEAYAKTLEITGVGVIFTGVTLAIGVVTWIFSPLKFQADMGILLTFMFLVNMLGAILLLPAIAAIMIKKQV
jgi:uncharacterized protein